MTDAWRWMPLHPPRPERTYTYPHQLLALPHHTYTTPLGLGLTEEGSLCTCFSLAVASWTVVEELEGGNLTLTQTDVDCYHPHRYPDLYLAVVLDLSQPGDTYARYSHDTKQWNQYNVCCVYRAQRLQIITIRPVRGGERLIMLQGAAHWQRHSKGLEYEYGNTADYQEGLRPIDCCELFRTIKHFTMSEGMEPQVPLYNDWTAIEAQTYDVSNIENEEVDCRWGFGIRNRIGTGCV
jgi:hypothetical protein